jgi:GTPase
VARAHADGEVLHAEHVADGTLLEARVPPGLAAQLEAAALGDVDNRVRAAT